MRGPRIKPMGELIPFSVNTRTAQKKLWLADHDFRGELYEIIIFWAKVFYVDIHALIIMSNHWHGAFTMKRQTLDKADIRRRWELGHEQTPYGDPWREDEEQYYYDRLTNLSEFMKVVNERAAWKHNKMYGTAGHLWGGRFHSEVIEGEGSMLRVLKYIELNATKAGMATDPTKYKYNTVSKIDEALRNDKPVEDVVIPAVGGLAEFHEDDRPLAYVIWIKIEAGMSPGDGHFQEGARTIVGTARAVDTSGIADGVTHLEIAPGYWFILVHGQKANANIEAEHLGEKGGWKTATKEPHPPG